MDKDTGGPAFPCAPVYDGNGNGIVEGAGGMTLRDWFAGQALVGLLAANPKPVASRHSQDAVLASGAFIVADAMVAERNKP